MVEPDLRRQLGKVIVTLGLSEIAKTAWVLDYPIFERIHYDLVAGFDVFGNVGHKISTRLYMDHVRMQGEEPVPAFLPGDRRKDIQASWYVGADLGRHHRVVDGIRSGKHGTQIPFVWKYPKAELLGMLLERNPALSGAPGLLNRSDTPRWDRPGASPLERRAHSGRRRRRGLLRVHKAPRPAESCAGLPGQGPGGRSRGRSIGCALPFEKRRDVLGARVEAVGQQRGERLQGSDGCGIGGSP